MASSPPTDTRTPENPDVHYPAVGPDETDEQFADRLGRALEEHPRIGPIRRTMRVESDD